MAVFELLIAFLIFVLCVYIQKWIFSSKSKRNYPPGPRGLPIFGSMFSIGGKPTFKYFSELREIYGDIFMINIASQRIVVLNGTKIIKKALAIPELNGKPLARVNMMRMEDQTNHGVLFSSGKLQEDQRRFTLKNLRDLGFGRKTMEEIFQFEVQELIERFKKHNGKPFKIEHQFISCMLNNIWSVVAGTRYNQEDPILDEFFKNLTSDLKYIRIFLLFPWLMTLSKWFPWAFGDGMGAIESNVEKTFNFLRKQVVAHKETLQMDMPRDFIDLYLIEIAKEKNPNSSFYGEEGIKNLTTVLNDLFLAGSETTSTTMRWFVSLLAIHPKVQNKMFEEIHSVVGNSRQPSLMDRAKMVYSEAVMCEVLRYTHMVPNIMHATTDNLEFEGFFIPKGATIAVNFYSALHGKDYWGDFEVFRPERFLSEDGQKLVKPEAYIPFSTGKRVCLGMPLALDELFIFSTTILQRFEIKPDASKEIPKFIEHGSSTGGIITPKPLDLIMKDRIK